MFGAFSFGSLINDLEEGVNTTFMILGNAGVLQMPIRRDKKKKRKESKKSNSVKSLLFYASVSWAKQEHFLFSHVLRSSSSLISSGSVQFPRATFTFLKLCFRNNPSSPIFLTYFFLVGVCQIPKNQCKKKNVETCVNLSTTVICVLDDQ